MWENHHHLQLINQLCKLLNPTDSSTTGVSDELTPWKCMLIFGGGRCVLMNAEEMKLESVESHE